MQGSISGGLCGRRPGAELNRVIHAHEDVDYGGTYHNAASIYSKRSASAAQVRPTMKRVVSSQQAGSEAK